MKSKRVLVLSGLNEQVDEIMKTKHFCSKKSLGYLWIVIPLTAYLITQMFHMK